MTEANSRPESDPDLGALRGQGGPPGVPRWVKVSALVVSIVVVALVLVMLAAGGEHGPGRHTGSLG